MPENKTDHVLQKLWATKQFGGTHADTLCSVCDIKTERELRGHISYLRATLKGTHNVASGDYGYLYTNDPELLRATAATLGAKIRGIQAAIDGLNNTIREIEGNNHEQPGLFDQQNLA